MKSSRTKKVDSPAQGTPEALSEAERQLESLIKNLPGMVYRCRPDKMWTMEYLNEKCIELTGYSREEIIANRAISYNEIIFSSDREMVWKKLQSSLKQDQRFELRYRIKTKEGAIKWVLEKGVGVKNSKGDLVQVEGFIQDITDLVTAENDLIRAHSRLDVTLKSIGDAVITTDTEGNVTFMNPAAEELTGITGGDSIGKPVSQVLTIINRQTGEPIENPVEMVLKNEQAVSMEKHTTLVSQNGKEYVISDSATPITDVNGDIIGAVLVFKDDTDKYLTAEKLEGFSRIFENSLNEIFILDATTYKFIYANKGALANLGYSLDELTGMTPLDIAYPLSKEKLDQLLMPLISDKEEKNIFELNHIRKDGTHYPAEIHLQKTSFNNQEAFVAMILDKTEEKETHKSLEYEQRRLEYVLEGTNSGIWEWNIESDSIFINDKWAEMLGYSVEELKPLSLRTWIKLTHPDDLKVAYDALHQHFRGETDSYECDTRMKHKNGEWIWVLDRGRVATWNSEGDPLLMAGTHQNITDRKRAEEELKEALLKAREADRMKSVFLASMSHELRTPLNAIIGFAELTNSNTTSEEAGNYSAVIEKSGKHLLSLVEEIFDITLMETGELRLSESKFRLNGFMSDLHSMMMLEKRSMERDETDFKLLLPENSDNIIICTDKKRVGQILLNLIKNAFKFTAKGMVELGYIIDGTNDLIEFFVRDTGIGIEDDKKEIIFDAFRQADESLSRSHGGVGLGLAIAKNLATLLGGSIHVESEKEKGTTFTLKLPAAAITRENNAEEEDKTVPNRNYSGKTILIAEDEESNYRLLKIILEKAGAKFLWAKSGREAVEICRSKKVIDLVLMDINMPEMNGFEATALIKKELPDLPVISQTAHANHNDRMLSLEAGCNDYIEKPIRRPLLFSKIDKFFCRSMH